MNSNLLMKGLSTPFPRLDRPPFCQSRQTPISLFCLQVQVDPSLPHLSASIQSPKSQQTLLSLFCQQAQIDSSPSFVSQYLDPQILIDLSLVLLSASLGRPLSLFCLPVFRLPSVNRPFSPSFVSKSKQTPLSLFCLPVFRLPSLSRPLSPSFVSKSRQTLLSLFCLPVFRLPSLDRSLSRSFVCKSRQTPLSLYCLPVLRLLRNISEWTHQTMSQFNLLQPRFQTRTLFFFNYQRSKSRPSSFLYSSQQLGDWGVEKLGCLERLVC